METLSEKKRLINKDAVIRNGALGMILFIATEMMFFGGLISGFVVNAADNIGAWPPKWQPRLPVYETAFNTFLLLVSAVTMFLAVKAAKTKDPSNKKVSLYLKLTMLLGAGFVIFQGVEWTQLIHAGMTTSSSLFGAFFYTIVGAHGLHAVGGLLYLIYVSVKILRASDWEFKTGYLTTISLFWYFVALLWPVLYTLVYILPSNQ
jgi:heme/copper-type cytochrome/quinol oxidase subunit 3